MRRHLFSVLSLLSLLLCVAAAALWVQSYYRPWRGDQSRARQLESVQGQLRFGEGPFGIRAPRMTHTTSLVLAGISYTATYEVKWWEMRDRRLSPVTSDLLHRTIEVRYWLAVVIFSILPTIGLPQHARERRRRRLAMRGLCSACGYDLRASKDRCPECGTPIAGDSAATAGRA